jgi:hypothetical protein
MVSRIAITPPPTRVAARAVGGLPRTRKAANTRILVGVYP